MAAGYRYDPYTYSMKVDDATVTGGKLCSPFK